MYAIISIIEILSLEDKEVTYEMGKTYFKDFSGQPIIFILEKTYWRDLMSQHFIFVMEKTF